MKPKQEGSASEGNESFQSSKLKSVVGDEVEYQRKPTDDVDMLKNPDTMETVSWSPNLASWLRNDSLAGELEGYCLLQIKPCNRRPPCY